MNSKYINVLLADDDLDDCNFFKKAIAELHQSINLTIVRDGEQLMQYLYDNANKLPDVLFLDLSMPRKNGIECLSEINEDEKLKDLNVVMFSTSFTKGIDYEQNLINTLLKIGANDFIRKPGDFTQLKQVINQVLLTVEEKKTLYEQKEY
jgi:CheY-like chemotaxis protein